MAEACPRYGWLNAGWALAGCWLEADTTSEGANGSMAIVKHHVPAGARVWTAGAERDPHHATASMHPCVVACWEQLLGRGAFGMHGHAAERQETEQTEQTERANNMSPSAAPLIGRALAGHAVHWLAAAPIG
jgi:hypothetical protein